MNAIAWWGAASGTLALIWQFVVWYRNGARVKIRTQWILYTTDGENYHPTNLRVLVVNSGRTPAQVLAVGWATPQRWNHWIPRPVRRLSDRLPEAMTSYGRTRKDPNGGKLKFPRVVDGQSTLEIEYDRPELIKYTIDFESEELRPFLHLGNGRRRLGRRVDLSEVR